MSRRRTATALAALVLASVFALGPLAGAQQPQPSAPTIVAPDQPPPPSQVPPDEAPAPDAAPISAAPIAPVEAPPPKPATPTRRPKYAIAILQAVDKVTAETERFEAPVGTPVRYKSLIFVVHACETTAGDEDINDAAAHVEITSQPLAPEGGHAPAPKRVFSGWMFAASPGLDLFQHPIYDAWLVACKGPLPSS